MRAAVASLCGLLLPLLLPAVLQAQDPERVIRRLEFVGNQSLTDPTLAAAISHHAVQLVRPQLRRSLARPRREAVLR